MVLKKKSFIQRLVVKKDLFFKHPYFRMNFLNGDHIKTSVVGSEESGDWTNSEIESPQLAVSEADFTNTLSNVNDTIDDKVEETNEIPRILHQFKKVYDPTVVNEEFCLHMNQKYVDNWSTQSILQFSLRC